MAQRPVGRRKRLTVIGYGLAALTKPVFPLAMTPFEVLGARFADRIGKGLRDAPRDALITDVTPSDLRGAAFGLRQSLDTIGAFVGPGLAIALMALFHDNMRTVFGFAVIPATAAVVVLALGVEEAPGAQARAVQAPIAWAEVRAIGSAFWIAVGVGVLFMMARFSEAFLVLRGSDVGVPLALTPVVLIVMNVIYALVAAPAGSLSDTLGRKTLLGAGVVALIAADALLAWSGGVTGVMLGVALWGLHMGLTQGLLAALVADAAPARLRGTAFGLFNLATGVTQLAASLAAGAVWSIWGPSETFLAGGGFALAGLIGLLVLLRDPSRPAATIATKRD